MTLQEFYDFILKNNIPSDTEICVDYDGHYQLQPFDPYLINRSDLHVTHDHSRFNSSLVIVHDAY